MTKNKLSRIIAKHIAIALVVASILGTFMWYIGTIVEDKEQTLRRLTTANNRLIREINKIEGQINSAQDSVDLYNRLNDNAKGGGGELKQSTITRLLEQLKDQYKISRLTMRMSPAKALERTVQDIETTDVVYSRIHLTFAGLTDDILLAFINSFMKKAPGYSRIESLSIKRLGSIDNQFLLDLSKEKYTPLVSGEIHLYLLGLKDRSSSKDKEEKSDE